MSGMRRTALIAVLALAAVPAAGGTTGSGLYGHVTRGPLTPVCTTEQPCYGPAAGVTLSFARRGAVVGRVTTAKDGSYRVALAPGIYAVRWAGRTGIGRGLEPTSAYIGAGHWTRKNFSIDTGIR